MSHPNPPDFCRSAAHGSLHFVLSDNEKSYDADCDEGYDSDISGLRPNEKLICPSGNPDAKTVRPIAKVPRPLKVLPPEPAIYRFEINDGQVPLIYIGKATNLLGRMSVYAEMVRRMLALYFGHKVIVDKNPLRYVHFEIAKALVSGHPVRLSYYTLPLSTSSQTLAREELLEISSAALHYANLGVFDYRFLNGLNSFKKSSHAFLPQDWQQVQAVL